MASNSENAVKCCSVNCELERQINTKTQARVEVKTFVLRDLVAAVKRQTEVAWEKNGEAIFHSVCWQKILHSAMTRKKANAELPNITWEEKSMVKEAAKTAEYFSSEEEILSAAKRVAELIKKSEHCIMFTGAGISTSSGIGDYRGKDGKWTNGERQLQGDTAVETTEPAAKRVKVEGEEKKEEPPESEEIGSDGGVNYESLMPTYAHEAVKKLMELGHVKHVISQNCDGLHRLSGVAAESLSELHGNVFVEGCSECGREYERPYYVLDDCACQYYEEMEEHGETEVTKPEHAEKCVRCRLTHHTGRKCEAEGCNGALWDTIINFRDHLIPAVLTRATEESQQCDTMVCLGTSLTVTPASNLIQMTKQPRTLIICNRQKTDLDGVCEVRGPGGKVRGCRVWGDCDVLMKEVMKVILSPDQLSTWEQGREQRLTEYAQKRVPHNNETS